MASTHEAKEKVAERKRWRAAVCLALVVVAAGALGVAGSIGVPSSERSVMHDPVAAELAPSIAGLASIEEVPAGLTLTQATDLPPLLPSAEGAVTTTQSSLGKDCGETSIDNDPNALQHLAVVGNGYGGSNNKGCLWYTTDAGGSWTRTAATASTSPTSGDPWLAYNNNNKLFNVRMTGGLSGDIQLMKSSDDGSSFTNTYTALGQTTLVTFPDSSTRAPCLVDYPKLGVDRNWQSSYVNDVYVITMSYFNMSGTGCPTLNPGDYTFDVVLSKSTDSGVTWTRTIVEDVGTVQDVMIAPNGDLYLSTYCGTSSYDGVGYVKSTDGGASWSSRVCAFSDGGGLDFAGGGCQGSEVAIAVQRNDANRVYMAFPARDASFNLHIYVVASSNAGASWGSPVRVDTAGGSNEAAYHCIPMISVGSSGRVDISWLDDRNGGATTVGDVYYSYSSDYGASFAANIRLTTGTFETHQMHWADYVNQVSVGQNKVYVAYVQQGVTGGSLWTLFVSKVVH